MTILELYIYPEKMPNGKHGIVLKKKFSHDEAKQFLKTVDITKNKDMQLIAKVKLNDEFKALLKLKQLGLIEIES